MNFHILTLFPEMVENGLKTSIIGRAVAGGLLSIEAVNIRDFAFNKHQSVDDYPYGGGAGMLMQAEPVYLAYKDIEERIQKRIQNAKMQNAETEEQDAEVKVQNAGIQDAETVSPDKKLRVVYLSPQGKTFDQKMAEELAEEEDLVLLCGHYEGIDERVLEEIVTDYVSIGDYVLTGGELPAMVMVDTISRLVPGVLHNDVSAEFESFQDNLLEYPQYSRPEEWHGKKVPPVLLSGHHANIEKWRREQSPEQLQRVKHYLVGTLQLTDYYSAAQYETEVLKLLEILFTEQDIVLLTGGSMMYVDAVCKGIDDIPTVDAETRQVMLHKYETEGLERLCAELKLLDPEYYRIVDLKNPKRVIHALEICYMTGKTYTSFRTQQKKERPFRIIKIGLTRDREELYAAFLNQK